MQVLNIVLRHEIPIMFKKWFLAQKIEIVLC